MTILINMNIIILTCYSKCPNGTYLLEDDKDNLFYDKNPDGYYLDKDKNLYKKCF